MGEGISPIREEVIEQTDEKVTFIPKVMETETVIEIGLILRWALYVNLFAWVCALVLLALKLTIQKVDDFTSYGKLQKIDPTELASKRNRENRSSVSAAADKVSALTVSHKFAFTTSYIMCAVWTLQLAATGYYATPEWKFTPIWNAVALFVGAFMVHILRRIYECFFVHKFSPREMSVYNVYLIMAFYIFVIMAPFVELMYYAAYDPAYLEELWVSSAATVCIPIAACLFLFGQYQQNRSHRILANLRPSGPDKDQKYYVPHGGLFKYVSSPHYFSEVLIYLSFVIYCQGQILSLWLIFIFVAVTMAHQAYQTHKWYTTDKRFGNYPSNRKILVPFVW